VEAGGLRIAAWLVAASVATLLAAPARAAEPIRPGQRKFATELNARTDTYAKEWFDEQFMTGDWGGWRSQLADHGVVATGSYQADIQANAAGGIRQAGRYFHNFALDLEFDLDRLVGWRGAQFHASMSQRTGQNLSEEAVGSVFNVATVCCGAVVKLVSLALEQSLFDERLDIAVGRLAAGDDFLTTPLDWKFVSNAFDGNPVGVFFQIPFSAYPNTQWGLRVRGKPTPELQLQFGVYNGDPEVVDDHNHGVDFSWRSGKGVVTVAEIAWLRNQRSDDTGLAGNYKLGGFFHSGPFDVLDEPGSVQHGNGGLYVHADQMLWRDGDAGSLQGVTPFVWLIYAPDEALSQVPFFANAGVVWRGAIPGRDDDELVFGGVYGWFSPEQRDQQRRSGVAPQHYEAALELGYIVQVTRWLKIQPDLQYVINPGAAGELDDAFVAGAQIVLAF
jgi:porin